MHERSVACHGCKESAVELEAVECILGALDVAAYVGIDRLSGKILGSFFSFIVFCIFAL
jgi:hypothetical protein